VTAESGRFPPARALAALIRAGEITPTQLLDRVLARIEETDADLKAYTTVCAEEARRDADAAERELAAGAAKSALHGLPVSVKDLIDTRGVRTTYGSRIFANNVPNADATVVRRLREAGAVVVGKTNTHEFALGGITPPTRNPFDLERIPGGSSGGSAAAIAAGSAVISLGSDTGGSIRIPASYCGVVGLKPTYGLVSRTGVFPESWSLDHVGPVTRYVEDAAVLLAAIAGPDTNDPTTTGITAPDYVAALEAGASGLRVGVPRNHFFEDVDDQVAAAVRAAIDVLASEGIEVEEVEFPRPDELLGAHTAIDLGEIASNHRRLYAEHAEKYQPDTKMLIEAGFFVRASTYVDSLRSRAGLLREVVDAMGSVDALLVPTQPIVAPKAGETNVRIGDREHDLYFVMVRLLAPFNLTGQPALSICCGFDNRNLPIGLQIVGRPFEDATVLRIAHAYESATDWVNRLPG
jgi:aspartyl-tRNA(Asn)/glutamyl-tRNA(Gln) amidotransferase subunit A